MEALLGDRRNRGELTQTLARRAAILVGGGLEKRKATRKSIASFYNLRSEMVHTGKPGEVQKPAQVAEAGIELAIQVIREVVALGKLPPWPEWELMGRPNTSSCGGE